MTTTDDGPINSLQHYETLLADVYDWMQGGWDQRAQQSRQLFEALAVSASAPGASAVDLGAGTGYQSIPLADLGFSVTAVDSSATMLAQLDERVTQRTKSGAASPAAGSVRTVEADLCRFADHVNEPPELLVCMGDTLSHLQSRQQVVGLIGELHRSQPAGGRLILGFRDASQPLLGDARFLPIRSDHDRLFTCFIEEIDDETVRIHDVLHIKNEQGFTQKVSSYQKIRLTTDWLVEQLIAEAYRQPEVTTEMGMTVISVHK